MDVLQAVGSAQLCVVTGKEFWEEEEKKHRNRERKENTERTDVKKGGGGAGSIWQGNKQKMLGL